MSARGGTRAPSTDELNGAISVMLAEGRKDWKVISSILKKEHPDWIVQDRRVAKFVKRQKAGNPISADDEESSVGSSSSRGSLRRLFGRRGSKKGMETKDEEEELVGKVVEGNEQVPKPEPPVTKEEKDEEKVEPQSEPLIEKREIAAKLQDYIQESEVAVAAGEKKKELCDCTGCVLL